jgi:hypothetical protein
MFLPVGRVIMLQAADQHADTHLCLDDVYAGKG